MTTTSEMARLLMMQGTQLPDAGLGPVTNTTRAGRPNPMLTASQDAPRPNDYMAPVAELLSLPMGAYGAGQLVGSGINAAREGDYASGAGQVALGMAGMLPMAPKGVRFARDGNTFKAFVGDKQIGHAYVLDAGDRLSVGNVNISPEFRRQGIGTALYNEIERATGRKLSPGDELTPDAQAFWSKRDPAALEGYSDQGSMMRRTQQTGGNDIPDDVMKAVAAELMKDKPQGIRAFHGSPHNYKAERLIEWPDGRTEYIEGMPDVLPDVPQGARVIKDFPLGRQRLDKIGTGEGAQAYGHGLYQAEAEGTARSYRDGLAPEINWSNPDEIAGFYVYQNDDLPTAIGRLEGVFGSLRNEADRPNIEKAIDILKSGKVQPWKPSGHMYEVNIKADPESFIDYDIPLGQQSEAVRRALDEAGLMPYTVVDQAGNRLDFSKGMPKAQAERFAAAKGGRAIPKEDADFDAVRKAQMMTGRGDAAQADIAAALREAGIPGIRYLDQMSRGEGKGSSNYVVFDDNLIEIMRKYGLLGPVAGGGTLAGMLMGGKDGETY